jgi:hypothetical protein
MFDASNLTAALTAIGSLIGLAGKADTVEFNQKIIEVQKGLIATQVDFLKLIEENVRLKADLENGKMWEFHHSVSWKKLPGGTEEGPYCPACRADRREMPLTMRGLHVSNPDVFLFSCSVDHGQSRQPRGGLFQIPKNLIKEDRYVNP